MDRSILVGIIGFVGSFTTSILLFVYNFMPANTILVILISFCLLIVLIMSYTTSKYELIQRYAYIGVFVGFILSPLSFFVDAWVESLIYILVCAGSYSISYWLFLQIFKRLKHHKAVN